MAKPNVLILRAPGTNCDQETAFAFARAGGNVQILHINRLLDSPERFTEFQILCIPGGFSYGDDVAAGRILGNQILHHLSDHLQQFKEAGKLILGICNGFQVLIKSGVLLDGAAETAGPPATLTWNDSGRFEDRWVRLAVHGSKCVFFKGLESMYLPIAHAEGKFVTQDPATLDQLDSADQLVLRYLPLADGQPVSNGPASRQAIIPYPDNPNGSLANVAGICDISGRILGLMPHPERHIDPTQHPRWTRGEGGQQGDGLAVFSNAISYFA